eukprot:TRINITY_DN2173_c0_g1_i1.p2 TRINITY_DN2173_c0_g1~~TRINITY_DN2173_c0_g1_i1.p2  ORF type:complete len:667 (-),score=214.79 TRINITY_DN2173_c0_g1_i1:5780-7780(-)
MNKHKHPGDVQNRGDVPVPDESKGEIEDPVHEQNDSTTETSVSGGESADESEEEYLTDHTAIENGIRDLNVPSRQLEKAVDIVERATHLARRARKFDTFPQSIGHFIQTSLPKTIQFILSRSDFPFDFKAHINEYLCLTLELIIALIPQDVPELLACLARLLGAPNVPYFQGSARSGKDTIADAIRKDYENFTDDDAKPDGDTRPTHYARLPKGAEFTPSIYYIQLINHFGKKGGFDAILKRVTVTSPARPPLGVVRALLRPVVNVKDYLAKWFVDLYVARVHDEVFAVLLQLTVGDLGRDDKPIFTEIGTQIQELLGLIWAAPEIDRAVEKFNMDVALKSFLSNILEKRLRGLKAIKKLVARAEQVREEKGFLKSFIQQAMYAPREPDSELKPLDARMLLDWLKKNAVVDNVAKLSAHPEVIRQATSVLAFVARAGQLDTQHVLMLYDASVGKHESERHTIFAVLAELAPALAADQIDALVQAIGRIAFKEYDVESVRLVHTLTNVSLTKSVAKSVPGLDLLWQLCMQVEPPLGSAVAETAVQLLTDLLHNPECAAQRAAYMDACVDNLKAGTGVLQSLLALRTMLGSVVSTKRKKLSPAAVIEGLEHKHQLLAAFFKELVQYRSAAEAPGCAWRRPVHAPSSTAVVWSLISAGHWFTFACRVCL